MTAVTVRSVASAEDLQSFKAMTVSYLEWLNEDLCFQGIEDELSGLPGCYSPDAQGCMLLAFSTSSAGGEVCIGAVALRALQGKQTDGLTKVSSVPVDDICEMKRLFVLPEHHGKGAGAALARAVMQRATELGYKAMVMDTLERLEGANKLYRSLGFENIEPYNHCPLPGVLYFFKLLR